jgi:natural product precursor
MKKLNLQLGSIKEMLTKEQMKKVAGGGYDCDGSGVACSPTTEDVHCCPGLSCVSDPDPQNIFHYQCI